MSAPPAARRVRLAVAAAVVLLGLAAVGVPSASLQGPLELRIAVVGLLAALAAGWSRTRGLSGVACVATVALVLFAAPAGRLSIPAAAVTGLLLLGFVLLADLADQVDRAALVGAGLAGWGRDHAPALGAGVTAVLAVTAGLALPWSPGTLVVVLAPALLAAGGLLALGHARAPRPVSRGRRLPVTP